MHSSRSTARRGLPAYALVFLLALLAAACQDSVTAPGGASPDSARPDLLSSSRETGGGAAFACFTSVATPGGPHAYRYGRLNLKFPRSALAPDGATMRYRFRVYDRDGEIERLANCVIPRTAEAARIMSRRFRIPGSVPRPKPIGSPLGEVTTQECTGDSTSGYECDELIVDGGGGDEGSEEPTCDVNTGENCDGYTGGGEGDGGGGNEPCADCEAFDDSPPADDEEFDCHLEPGCTLKPADDTQKQAMKAAIEQHINQAKCPQVYSTALDLVSTSQVWEERIKDPGTGGTFRGDYLRENHEMHVWTGNFDSPDKWLPWTLSHEAVHALQFELNLSTHQEIHDYGDSCLNFAI